MPTQEIAQVNGATGGTFELAIPWSDFNAAENHPEDTGLFHPMAPTAGEEWFLNMSRISSDQSNFLPIWQFNATQGFAARPDGVVTFVPDPGSATWCLIGGLFALVSRPRRR